VATRGARAAAGTAGGRVSQQPFARRIAGLVAAFHGGLRESGFVEGQNLVIAFCWAEGRYEQLRDLAAELVGMHVAVLMAAGGPPSALAAKAATSTIPIVFSSVYDPVQLGLVASLNRPGANVTGVTNLIVEVAPKWLELLHELLPTASVVALLVNPANRALAQAQARELLA
jgi:putative tryptophan/tyrosine transport system substrate-binding protein